MVEMDTNEKLFYLNTILVIFFGFGKILDLMLTLIALNIPYSTIIELNPLFNTLSSTGWLVIAFVLIALYGICVRLAYEHKILKIQKVLLVVILFTSITVYYAVFNNMWVLYVYLS